jgi:hypothetical protein
MTVTYDIYFLGLSDPSAAGRDRFFDAMERLTEKRAMSFEPILRNPTEPLMRSVDQSQAESAVMALQQAGAWVEIRPLSSAPAGGGGDWSTGADSSASPMLGEPDGGAAVTCPSCGATQPDGFPDCQSCGVVFAKLEREEVQKQMRDRRLDDALQKVMGIRQEWDEKAQAYLEKNPMPADATTPFNHDLFQAEVPFQLLNAHEGPLLMTSRRIMFQRGGQIGSIPYEMISDVDVGGGLAVSKNRVKMKFTFRCELPLPGGTTKELSWQIDKAASQKKDVIMDWVFSRRFMCGSCGEPDLDFRLDSSKACARCMRCATDHEVDLAEAIVIPAFVD